MIVAFLIGLTSYQFLLRCVHLEGTAIYFILNPYVLLAPFVVIWIGSLIVEARPVDRNLALGVLFLLAFPLMMLRTYTGAPDFAFLFIRGFQFFWGPLLIVPGLLGLFRTVRFTDSSGRHIRRYLYSMALLTGSLTLLELISVKVLGVSPLIFPWIYGAGRHDIVPFRPWGLPAFSQVNAVLLALLFWLSYLHGLRGIFHKAATYFGTLLSLSGTGQVGLLGMTPLVFRRPFLGAVIGMAPLAGLMAYATVEGLYSLPHQNLLARFDFAYFEKLFFFFTHVGWRFFARFRITDFLFGAPPTHAAVIGITHDWAYLDIFYAYGAAGVVGYLMLYSALLYLSCPLDCPTSKKVYFVIGGLVLNFHYGTLNYYVGQLMFCCLGALQLNHIYSRQMSLAPVPQRA